MAILLLDQIKYLINDTPCIYHFHEESNETGSQILYSAETCCSDNKIVTNCIESSYGSLLCRGAKDLDGTTTSTEYLYSSKSGLSPFVQRQNFSLNNNSNRHEKYMDYTYDNCGNIASISKNGAMLKRYEYDQIEQLECEYDTFLNESTDYFYDDGGNIVQKSTKNYDNNKLTPDQRTILYKYDDIWSDKLISYDGKKIAYDTIGNPISFNDNTYNWMQGRTLHSTSNNERNVVYTYNEEGLRTQKDIYSLDDGNNVSKSFKYYWNGTMLTTMTISTESLTTNVTFVYEKGSGAVDWVTPVGFIVDGKHNYYYEKNFSGDVLTIYHNGKEMANYQYDAYGCISNATENSDYNSDLNPFYYHGYQYDIESNMYYLYSRYYCPEWGRFLNADAYVDTGTGLLGTNMFAFCDNNPANKSDPFGYWAKGDHKIWTMDMFEDSVKGTYLSQIADNNLDTDNMFPATLAWYQYIHFDRTPGDDDSRAEYAAARMFDAVDYCIASNSSSAMVQLGYGLHAMQDIVAHGQIATEWRLADHAIRPALYPWNPVIFSWLHADNVTYKWEDSGVMRKLIADTGVTSGNYKTTSTRYAETTLYSALMIVAFKLNLPTNLRPTYFY